MTTPRTRDRSTAIGKGGATAQRELDKQILREMGIRELVYPRRCPQCRHRSTIFHWSGVCKACNDEAMK